MTYYEFTPADTLFFNGSIPFAAGLTASDALFPPYPSVLSGAVCGASGNFSEENLPKVLGIFLKEEDDFYAQAPYSWFWADTGGEKRGVARAFDNAKEFEKIGAVSSHALLPWVDVSGIKSAGGEWVNTNLLQREGRIEREERQPLFEGEDRVGIALSKARSAEEGHLYTHRHLRLKEGVTLVAAFDRDILDEEGIMVLGGLARWCGYRKIKGPEFREIAGARYYTALAPVLCKTVSDSSVFCGKVFTSAGWDFARKKPKPSAGWYCAGTVFTRKVDDSCVSIYGGEDEL